MTINFHNSVGVSFVVHSLFCLWRFCRSMVYPRRKWCKASSHFLPSTTAHWIALLIVPFILSTSSLAAGQYGVTLLCSMLCLRKYSVNSFAINCGSLSVVIYFGYPKIANVFSRLLRTLLAVTDFITAATGYLDL